MKLVSWNVNGLRACLQKGFLEQFDKFDADFFCLQETKLSEGVLELDLPGYEQYWCYAEKKGYSGTAIFTKHMPLSVHYGLNVPELDSEGRLITLEYPEFYLVTCYTPNAQRELARIDHRMKWDDAFRAYLSKLDAEKPVILCGDLNVAHQEIDLKNPKSNRGSAGFSDQERESFQKTLDQGFTDTFRHLHPDSTGCYSWWSYMFHAREKNAGWRIDYFLVSDRIRETVYRAEIHADIFGSDHCPVSIETDLPCNGGILSPSSLGKARDLSQPDKATDTMKASAVKAKAIIPFALICLILCALLLIESIGSLVPPQTEPTEPIGEEASGDLLRIHTYDDVPWSYMIVNQNIYSDTSLGDAVIASKYVNSITDGGETFYVSSIQTDTFYRNNVLLRLELTDEARKYGLEDEDVLSIQLTPTLSSGILDSLFPGQAQDPVVSSCYFAKYYLDSLRTELGGWIVLWNIPKESNYTLRVFWEDDRFVHLQALKLTPTGSEIPENLDKPLTVTDLTEHFPEVYELPIDKVQTASVLHFGDSVYYSTIPVTGQEIQNSTWWKLAVPDPLLTDALPFAALSFDAYASGSSIDFGFMYMSPWIRPVFADPELTQQVGWIVHGIDSKAKELSLTLSWNSVAQSHSNTYLVEISQTADPSILSTEDIVDRMVQDSYLQQQLADYAFGEITDIQLLKWLLEREDCVEALMNYPCNTNDPGYNIPEMLLNVYELNIRMTPEQKVKWLLYDYPASNFPVRDLSLEMDSDPSSYTTEELALYLLTNTSIHTQLLHQCGEYRVQVVMLEYMRSLCPTIDEYLSREDLHKVRKMMPAYKGYSDSIHAYVDLLVIPDKPEDMTTDQLVTAIVQNTALCDGIISNGPDFESDPYLKALAAREDAVYALMNCVTPAEEYIEIPYLLLSHPDIRYKMTPQQEADYLMDKYASSPFEREFGYDQGLDLTWMTTEQIVDLIITNGDASLLTSCTTQESALLVFQYLYEYSPQLMNIVYRFDTQDVLNSKQDSDPAIAILASIWPSVMEPYQWIVDTDDVIIYK